MEVGSAKPYMPQRGPRSDPQYPEPEVQFAGSTEPEAVVITLKSVYVGLLEHICVLSEKTSDTVPMPLMHQLFWGGICSIGLLLKNRQVQYDRATLGMQ